MKENIKMATKKTKILATEPVVTRGSHSIRTEYPDGRVEFESDWDKLKADVEAALAEYEKTKTKKVTKKVTKAVEEVVEKITKTAKAPKTKAEKPAKLTEVKAEKKPAKTKKK